MCGYECVRKTVGLCAFLGTARIRIHTQESYPPAARTAALYACPVRGRSERTRKGPVGRMATHSRRPAVPQACGLACQNLESALNVECGNRPRLDRESGGRPAGQGERSVAL